MYPVYEKYTAKQGQGRYTYDGNVAFASAVPSRGPFLYTFRKDSKSQENMANANELAKSELMRNYHRMR